MEFRELSDYTLFYVPFAQAEDMHSDTLLTYDT